MESLPGLSRHSIDEKWVKFGLYLLLGSCSYQSIKAASVSVIAAFVSSEPQEMDVIIIRTISTTIIYTWHALKHWLLALQASFEFF